MPKIASTYHKPCKVPHEPNLMRNQTDATICRRISCFLSKVLRAMSRAGRVFNDMCVPDLRHGPSNSLLVGSSQCRRDMERILFPQKHSDVLSYGVLLFCMSFFLLSIIIILINNNSNTNNNNNNNKNQGSLVCAALAQQFLHSVWFFCDAQPFFHLSIFYDTFLVARLAGGRRCAKKARDATCRFCRRPFDRVRQVD